MSDTYHPPPDKGWQRPTDGYDPSELCECGSPNLRPFSGYFGTGVYHPDGGEEHYWREGVRCLDCGNVEEF